LAVERGKVNTIIFQATHNEALRALFRWAGVVEDANKKTWSIHVYRMAEAMLNLIDQRQVTFDICAQFIEAVRKKVSIDEEDDNQEGINHTMVSFFNVSELFMSCTYKIFSIFHLVFGSTSSNLY
jgi:hypothetical protein